MSFVIGLFVSFGANSVYGLWIPRSAQELLEQSQTIFVGDIIGVKAVNVTRSTTYGMEENGIPKTIVENYTLILGDYDVKIEEFLKNPQNLDAIKVRQPTISGAPSRLSVVGGFEKGDRVLFYLDKIDDENMYSPESFKIPKECNSETLVFSPKPFPSPYEIKQGNLVNPQEFISGINIHFSYPIGYNTLESVDHDFEVKITKIDKKSKEPEFEKTFRVYKKICEWTSVVEWDFVPDPGEYLVQISNSYDQSTTTSIITVIPTRDPDKIEFIEGKLFFVSEKYKITHNPSETIMFHVVRFTHPAFSDPPAPGGGAFTDITFQDGTKETLSNAELLKSPILFTKHTDPQAGIRKNTYDTFSILVSADLTKISPLQQFKAGLAPADVVCKSDLVLVMKMTDNSLACVKPEHSGRLLSNGWFSVHPSDRAIRPLVTVIESSKDLGIGLTEMQVMSKQSYGTFHADALKISAFQGVLLETPTVVSKITNVSNQIIVLNQVLITGSIILSPGSTATIMYADAIGCSVSHLEDGKTMCPYTSAIYDPVQLSPNESFVSYFSDDFIHKLGPINKITVSIWYGMGADAQQYRTEIDYVLDIENEN